MKMKNQIIGIVGTVVMETNSPVIGFLYDHVRNDYAKAIVAGGGVPIYLPVINDEAIIEEYVRLCDGILIPGGLDVNPLFYGEQPLPLLEQTIPVMDQFQISLIQEAFKQRKAILAICRGHQMLTVALGGTLYQDISYAVTSPLQHMQQAQLYDVVHHVTIMPNTLLSRLFGSDALVNSAHHQAVQVMPPQFLITALAADGVIEGIEYAGDCFVVGVQWHPETMLEGPTSMVPLFKSFIKATK